MKKLAMLAAASLVAAVGCAAEPSSGGGEEDSLTGADAFTARVSTHAIVLAHGFDGSLTNRWSFYKVADKLRDDGHVVHAAQVSPYKGVPARAAELAVHVDAAQRECRAKPGCDASKVHIIAHSMGGLDSRYLISKLGYGDRVASLTTISTPHRGSNIADVLLKIIPDDVDGAVNAMASMWGRTFTERDLADDSDVKAALSSISEKTTRDSFNPEVKDDARVAYISWAGVSEVVGIPNPKDYDACEGKLQTRLGIRDGMDLSLVAGFALRRARPRAPSERRHGDRRERQVGQVHGLHSRRPPRRGRPAEARPPPAHRLRSRRVLPQARVVPRRRGRRACARRWPSLNLGTKRGA